MKTFNSNKDTSGFHCEFCGRKFSLRIQVVQHRRKNHKELLDIKDSRVETGSNSSGYISDGYADGPLAVSIPTELTARPPSGQIAETQVDANSNITRNASTRVDASSEACRTTAPVMERPSVISHCEPISSLLKTEYASESVRDFVTSRKRFTCCLCPLTFNLLPEWFVHYEQCHHADAITPVPDPVENPTESPESVNVAPEPSANEDSPWQSLPDLGHLTRMRCFLGALREKVAANALERWETDAEYESDAEPAHRNMSSGETVCCERHKAYNTACTMCAEMLSDTSSATQKEQDDASLQCPDCPRKFTFLVSMRKHLQKLHSVSCAQRVVDKTLKKDAPLMSQKRAESDEDEELFDVNLFNTSLSPPECNRNVLENVKVSLGVGGVTYLENQSVAQEVLNSCFLGSETFKRSEALKSHMKLAHGTYGDMNLGFISKTDKADAQVRSDCVIERDKLHNKSGSIIHSVKVHKENNSYLKCVSNGSENPCLIRPDSANNELNNSTCQPTLRSQSVHMRRYEQACVVEQPYHLEPAQIMKLDLIPKLSGNENFVKNSDTGVEAAWEEVRAEAIRRRRFSRRTISTASRGVYPKRCRHCPKWLFSPEAMKTHSKVHGDSETPIGCPQCSSTFYSKSLVEDHIKREHDRLNSFQDGGQMRELQKPSTEALQVERKKYGFFGKRQQSLRSRLPTKLRCSYCPKYLHPSSIIAHEKIHTGGKPFDCPSCFRSFGRHDHLKKHLERIHSSAVASKATTARGSRKPKRTSCKPKPNKEECNNNHELKLFCQECGKAAASNQALVNHRRVHADEKNLHTCPHCGKVFRYFKNFRCHMLLMHDELPPMEALTNVAKKPSKIIPPARDIKASSIKMPRPAPVKKPHTSGSQLKKKRIRITEPANQKMEERSDGREARMKRSLKRKTSDEEIIDEDLVNEWETPYICLLCDNPFRRFESLKVHLKNWHQLVEEQADGLAKVIQSQHDLVEESEKARNDVKLPDEGVR